MDIEKHTIREIGDIIIEAYANSTTPEDKAKVYEDFKRSMIKYGLPENIFTDRIKYNFYNYDLLAIYDEPTNNGQYLEYLALANLDLNVLYDTVLDVVSIANGYRAQAKE